MENQSADEVRAKLLQMKGIDKSFSGVMALTDVCFDLKAGEVHALVGENGAGKSTLMHILAGVHQPESGSISIEGSTVTIESEKEAQRLGVGMVFQEGSLVESLSVAENIFAARQPTKWLGVVDFQKLYQQTRDLLHQFDMDLDPKELVEHLSHAEKQEVEIAKALSLNAKLIIFDEPTSSLTQKEVALLFRLIARLKGQGVGVIYISHRLEEIFEISDRITVLKDGRYCGTFRKEEMNSEELVSRMVGRDFLKDVIRSGEVGEDNAVALEVENLSDGRIVHDASFIARRGEVTAFAGLAGAGRSELALTIMGARKSCSGRVCVHGKEVSIKYPGDAIRAGIGYLPEDRKEAGLFQEMSIQWNLAAADLKRFGNWWMDDRKLNATTNEYCRKLNVSSLDLSAPVQKLSGGNQQKVLLARWLLLAPEILIVDEPTRGIDVAAKQEIHHLLHRLARAGTAVIMMSSELPEILAVADRILVMRRGHIVGRFAHEQATEEKIMHYASLGVEAAV